MAMDDDLDFSFSAPMQELHEIAIISIAGGTNVPLAEKAYHIGFFIPERM